MKCGREIREPVKFCPYCAAALPGAEDAEEERTEQDPNIGYWNFYGAVPDEEDLTAGPMGTRGWLRFAAVVVFIASAVLGLALNGWSWGFRWARAGIIWATGVVLALILFGLSFAFKKPE